VPRLAAIGGLGDRHIQVLVDEVQRQIEKYMAAGAGAGQPRVPKFTNSGVLGSGRRR
jgi:hypothetical protein